MGKYQLAGITKDGKEVFWTKEKKNRLPLEIVLRIPDALKSIDTEKAPIIWTVCFPEIIGNTICITVSDFESTNIFWVYRKNKPNWRVPIYFKGTPQKTTYLTIIFRQIDDKVVIADSYYGKRTPPLPGTKDAHKYGKNYWQKCQDFWTHHALIVSLDEIDIEKTLSKFDESTKKRFLATIET